MRDDVTLEVQAARKAHANNDIVKLCSSRRSMWAHPSAQGIGLFTHVAGIKTVTNNPHASLCDQVDKEVALLPIGGPRKIAPSKIRESPNKELVALYKELQDAVRAEEKIFEKQRAVAEERGGMPKGAYRMPFDTLKKKYGTIIEPPLVIPPLGQPQGERRQSENTGGTTDEPTKKKRKVNFAPESESRRHSISSMSSTGTEKRGSGSSTANDYDVHRDPRRQRR